MAGETGPHGEATAGAFRRRCLCWSILVGRAALFRLTADHRRCFDAAAGSREEINVIRPRGGSHGIGAWVRAADLGAGHSKRCSGGGGGGPVRRAGTELATESWRV